MKRRLWAAGVLGALLLLTACGSSSTSTSSAPPAAAGGASNQVRTASTSAGTVLVDSQGKTIYWFAIDTPTKSMCTGPCTTVWPAVPGPVKAAPGTTLMHGFGTIKGSDGKVQATYDGHPLYTFAGDTAPGQVHGNGKPLNGGFWWAMTPSGAKLSAAKPKPSSSSSSSGGGGYY
jgi:predicted lipoprotein with Yx(FWY)xxD motif